MKKLIFMCFLISLVLLGCSKEEKEQPATINETEITITGITDAQQVTLVTDQEEKSVTNGVPVKVEEDAMFSLEIVEREKNWVINNLFALPNTTIDLSGYQFNLEEVKQLLSQYGIEHSRAMALKDMTEWTSITDNYLTSAEGDYINETLYEGQFKQLNIDLNSFQMMEANKLIVQAQLVFEEMYYLTEEVESLHKGHSHGDEDSHNTGLSSKSYTINFSLAKIDNSWKVEQLDFPSTSMDSSNVMTVDVQAPFFTPTNEAIELAEYYLDYKQISLFLEEFFGEYVKALNFKNIEYISAYTTNETIFHQKVKEQLESNLVELLDLNIISMDKQSENLFKWNVELLLYVNGEEKLEQYEFYVTSNNDNYFITSP